MRSVVLAAILGCAAAAGCTSEDLAVFNVAMDEANGAYWPDQSDSKSMDCASGSGYVMQYSGVSGGDGYLYYVSHADYVDIEVTYDDGDVYSFGLQDGETSYTMYNHPGYHWSTSWSC